MAKLYTDIKLTGNKTMRKSNVRKTNISGRYPVALNNRIKLRVKEQCSCPQKHVIELLNR